MKEERESRRERERVCGTECGREWRRESVCGGEIESGESVKKRLIGRESKGVRKERMWEREKTY